ncbi:9781_t:CDS:2, partial [Gigaspora margarita]
ELNFKNKKQSALIQTIADYEEKVEILETKVKWLNVELESALNIKKKNFDYEKEINYLGQIASLNAKSKKLSDETLTLKNRIKELEENNFLKKLQVELKNLKLENKKLNGNLSIKTKTITYLNNQLSYKKKDDERLKRLELNVADSDNILIKNNLAIRSHKESIWKLVDELTNAFNLPNPIMHELFSNSYARKNHTEGFILTIGRRAKNVNTYTSEDLKKLH